MEFRQHHSPICLLGLKSTSLQYDSNVVLELRRSGIPRCKCQVTPITATADTHLPLSVDVVMLARLDTARDFLMLDQWDVKRIVYELKPDTMADVDSFQRFIKYLKHGRDGYARAGVALEMHTQGYKIFILPPGQVARMFGYDGDMMLAILRSR
ncbi:endocytosis defective- protein [Phytophthora boehmeriae]|uniref:Endocytosis defective- protein n=1 Tax=Phytophthora boehmeriae TaxID=109152 RepID=A0A8T1X838_9STRA|nr:endocytosis defective- protein [Phytophthora boehmeriae]